MHFDRLIAARFTRYIYFLTAILHRGLRNDFFFHYVYLLFPIFIWTFISLFSLDFYFLFLFGLLFSLFSLDFYFPFLIGLLFPFYFSFPFFLWTFIQSQSHFGFLPNFFHCTSQFYVIVKKSKLQSVGYVLDS
jgi:hypothetical protein